MKNLFIFILIFGFMLLFLTPTPAYASLSATACYVTNVGTPNTALALPPECAAMDANNDLLKAAQSIKNAYGACLGGQTVAGSGDCMKQKLTEAGYSATQVGAFTVRRSTTITSTGCTQCLGFVGLALSLLSGKPDALLGIGAASGVLANSTITTGDFMFQKMPSGTAPQPGDIGVSSRNKYGHILIVKKAEGNTKIIAVEANWKQCYATDDISHNQLLENYTFYRKSSKKI